MTGSKRANMDVSLYGHMPMHQSEFISMTGTYVTNWCELESQAS